MWLSTYDHFIVPFLVLALSEGSGRNEELYKEKWWKAAWLDPDKLFITIFKLVPFYDPLTSHVPELSYEIFQTHVMSHRHWMKDNVASTAPTIRRVIDWQKLHWYVVSVSFFTKKRHTFDSFSSQILECAAFLFLY